MSSNTLIDKIRTEADAEVANIQATADAEVARIERETAAAIEVLRAEAASALEKKQAQQELVATSKAKQEGKLAAQRAKREALDNVFNEVFDTLVEQSSAEYIAFFTAQAEVVLPKEVKVVSVAAPENRIAETKEILNALGLSGDVTASTDIKAGFAITAEDGVYDVTFTRLFALARPELEMEVMQKFLAS